MVFRQCGMVKVAASRRDERAHFTIRKLAQEAFERAGAGDVPEA
jgi:hypothetical protein